MNINEFINKNNNKKIDFDGVYGCQCVDLFRQYCKDVLQIPHTGGVEGAKDLFFDYDKNREKEFFIKIKNENRVFARAGDVAIWNGTERNKYGHVAIVVSELNGDLVVFEQDGIKQDGAKITIRTKENLLGYLRKM